MRPTVKDVMGGWSPSLGMSTVSTNHLVPELCSSSVRLPGVSLYLCVCVRVCVCVCVRVCVCSQTYIRLICHVSGQPLPSSLIELKFDWNVAWKSMRLRIILSHVTIEIYNNYVCSKLGYMCVVCP